PACLASPCSALAQKQVPVLLQELTPPMPIVPPLTSSFTALLATPMVPPFTALPTWPLPPISLTVPAILPFTARPLNLPTSAQPIQRWIRSRWRCATPLER